MYKNFECVCVCMHVRVRCVCTCVYNLTDSQDYNLKRNKSTNNYRLWI